MRLGPPWWNRSATSSCADASFQPSAFRSFVLIVIRVIGIVINICTSLLLRLLNTKLCVSRRLRILMRIAVWLLLRLCLLIVSGIFLVAFSIVSANALAHDEFFNIKLGICRVFGQNSSSLILIEIRTQAIHKRWLKYQIIKLSVPFVIIYYCKF
jgi:hypothetical protein